MRMRIIIIVNLILLIFLSCSSTVTRRELTDISWIRNDSLLLEYQNYEEDGNTFDVSDTLMNSSLVFVPLKMIVFLLFRTLYRDFVTERVTLWFILR